MSIRDEIDRVILDEAKSDERKKKLMQRKAGYGQKGYQSRFEKPTYFAVLVGKLLYRLHREKPRKPVSQRTGIEGYNEHDFVEKPKVTIFTIFKEDLHNLPKKLLTVGTKRKKPAPDIPNSKESIEDWKEYFEDDARHAWQGVRKNE